jgi:hypothetical protein
MKKKKTERDPLYEFMTVRNRQQTSKESVLDHEHEAASLVGGVRHGGSGSSSYRKSDASSDDYQVECKQTAKKSISLKLEWLQKITQEALSRGREPMLHLRFIELNGDCPSDWVCVPVDVWRRLHESRDV